MEGCCISHCTQTADIERDMDSNCSWQLLWMTTNSSQVRLKAPKIYFSKELTEQRKRKIPLTHTLWPARDMTPLGRWRWFTSGWFGSFRFFCYEDPKNVAGNQDCCVMCINPVCSSAKANVRIWQCQSWPHQQDMLWKGAVRIHCVRVCLPGSWFGLFCVHIRMWMCDLWLNMLPFS